MTGGIASTGQESADQEELRQGGRDEEHDGGFAALDPGADGLAHETGRQDERRREQEQVRQPAGRREAVDMRQDHEIEQQRRHIDDEMGETLGEDGGRSRVAAAPCCRRSRRRPRQHRGAHQQRLLQDQHESRRHDIAGIAAGRIEQRHRQDRAGLIAARQPTRRSAARASWVARSAVTLPADSAMPCSVRLKTRK